MEAPRAGRGAGMSAELFNIIPTPLSRLAAARIRFISAESDYLHAEEWEDDTGNAIPDEISREFSKAKGDLARAEYEEIGRIKRTL